MLDLAELLRNAEHGMLLLAPNLRAARQLRARLIAAGRPALAEQVTHWRAWTASMWLYVLLHGMEDRALLQPMQERVLWEPLLDAEPHVQRTDALLDLCQSAVDLTYRYGAQEALLQHGHASAQDDTARFVRWFRTFWTHCDREKLLPNAALEAALAEHVRAGASIVTGKIVLCGLADLHPSQQALLDALQSSGVDLVKAPNANPRNAAPVLLSCADPTQEMYALIAHLAAALGSATRPDIAIIVPDLSTSRDRIDRAMRERFAPASVSAFAEERRPLWEFSTGRPLAAHDVVVDALRLLAWTVHDLETAEISSLLRSPYFDWPVDAESAAQLDVALLRRAPYLRATWSPRQAARALGAHGAALQSKLVEGTTSWSGLRNAVGSYSAFVSRTLHILRDFGWPGRRTRTSQEYQSVERWETMLDALATLDAVAPPPTWTGFQHRLAATTREQTFAHENTGAPIQFLTPEESTGTEAAELWVAHAEEGTWSSHRATHPLLAWRIQQQFGMPGVDPLRDGARFRQEVERIAAIASVVTFSYASVGEAGEQRPCAAVHSLPGLQHSTAAGDGVVAHLHAAAELETFSDDTSVPLAPADLAEPIRGGVRVLQSQAACAFRAFAELRLASTALETTDLGLDARERGSLLHRALESFWETTPDRATLLCVIAEGRLRQAIQHAIAHALSAEERPHDAWSSAYLQIERERLTSLMEQWLRGEAERPDFRVIAREQRMTVSIGPLPLTVKVDRIDEVTIDGTTSRVILDYKTSDHRASKWEGDRPEEPQLPLYATSLPVLEQDAAQPAVGAIAFGIVRPGKDMQFRSMPDKTALLNTGSRVNSDSLGEQLNRWRSTLQELAQDFAAGIAKVGPKEYPSTCRYCDQRLLCRLNPELLDSGAEDNEAEA